MLVRTCNLCRAQSVDYSGLFVFNKLPQVASPRALPSSIEHPQPRPKGARTRPSRAVCPPRPPPSPRPSQGTLSPVTEPSMQKKPLHKMLSLLCASPLACTPRRRRTTPPPCTSRPAPRVAQGQPGAGGPGVGRPGGADQGRARRRRPRGVGAGARRPADRRHHARRHGARRRRCSCPSSPPRPVLLARLSRRRALPGASQSDEVKCVWTYCLPLPIKRVASRLLELGRLSWGDLLEARRARRSLSASHQHGGAASPGPWRIGTISPDLERSPPISNDLPRPPAISPDLACSPPTSSDLP